MCGMLTFGGQYSKAASRTYVRNKGLGRMAGGGGRGGRRRRRRRKEGGRGLSMIIDERG